MAWYHWIGAFTEEEYHLFLATLEMNSLKNKKDIIQIGYECEEGQPHTWLSINFMITRAMMTKVLQKESDKSYTYYGESYMTLAQAF